MMRILLAAFCCFVLTSCGSDDSPTAPEPKVDLDPYMASLPTWEEYSPLLVAQDAPTDEPSYTPAHIVDNVRFVCKSTPCSITQNPEQIATYSPAAGVLWLGALIQGNSYAGGLGTLMELPIRQRAPLRISIDDFSFSDNNRTIENPDGLSVGEALQEMVATAAAEGLQRSGILDYDKVEAHSSQQALLKLGLSAKYMGASARASFEFERESEEYTYAAKFIDQMFTTSISQPQRPSDMFSDAFTQGLFQEQVDLDRVGPDNLPVYVSSITWGRMLVMTITSTFERTRIEAALKASYENAVGGVGVSASAMEVLSSDETHITVVALGGNTQGVENLITSGNMRDYFAQQASVTTAVPLSYVLRNLADNKIAKVSETFAYEMEECSPSVQCFGNYYEWEQAANAVGTHTVEFNTTAANASLCDEFAVIGGTNMDVGSQLTWTNLDVLPGVTFQLKCVESGMTWNDQEGPTGQRLISIGDVDNYDNDDFEIDILQSACHDQMVAFGLWIHDNVRQSGETLAVYDTNNQQMAHFTGSDIPDGSYKFLGVVSPLPFTRFVFDESDYKGDDIFIRDFRFGVRTCP